MMDLNIIYRIYLNEFGPNYLSKMCYKLCEQGRAAVLLAIYYIIPPNSFLNECIHSKTGNEYANPICKIFVYSMYFAFQGDTGYCLYNI